MKRGNNAVRSQPALMELAEMLVLEREPKSDHLIMADSESQKPTQVGQR
jgi:hypothetical protein